MNKIVYKTPPVDTCRVEVFFAIDVPLDCDDLNEDASKYTAIRETQREKVLQTLEELILKTNEKIISIHLTRISPDAKSLGNLEKRFANIKSVITEKLGEYFCEKSEYSYSEEWMVFQGSTLASEAVKLFFLIKTDE